MRVTIEVRDWTFSSDPTGVMFLAPGAGDPLTLSREDWEQLIRSLEVVQTLDEAIRQEEDRRLKAALVAA